MSVGQEHLRDLCERASEVARARGHELEGWSAPSGEAAIARAAVCRRCGRVAYVRAESGLIGAAGDALVQPCGAPSIDGAP
jgi:hypothetical protein